MRLKGCFRRCWEVSGFQEATKHMEMDRKAPLLMGFSVPSDFPQKAMFF